MTTLEIIALIALAYLSLELLAQYIGTLYYKVKGDPRYFSRKQWIPGFYVWHFFYFKTWRGFRMFRKPEPEITEEV